MKDDLSTKMHYVGIAASAGGLEASSALVNSLPQDLNAAYIIAQHMAPQRESLLTALLARETTLTVVELEHKPIAPRPATIYVPPPNKDVIYKDGKLHLMEPSTKPGTPKPSADRLFVSLAENHGKRAAGIVLSGTGRDGSHGVQTIHEHGGITVAQSPDSAKFDGMPASAISTGCVDLILNPNVIGAQLHDILQRSRDLQSNRPIQPAGDMLEQLMQILQARTRVNFRDYKEQTVQRRIQRRMDALSVELFRDYVEHCRNDIGEVDTLYKDLLISVTRFFRDPSQFAQLSNEIVRIVEEKGDEPLRIWVAGCATGEEVYTVAIIVSEALGGPEQFERQKVQIFGTDIDDSALNVARRGTYPVSAAKDIPEPYLERYFLMSQNTITVVPELRNLTLFSKHNLIQDPPFIKIDLVTLRNVLIYFKPNLQERVLSRVHFALSSHGILLLGTSEAVGAMELMFEAKQGTDKIYLKRHTVRYHQMFAPDLSDRRNMQADGTKRDSEKNEQNQNEMFEALVRSVGPNSFIITRNQDIVRVFGDVSPLLELTESTGLRLSTRILRKGLREEVPGLVTLAFRRKEARFGRWHAITGPDFNEVRIACYPIFATEGEDHLLLAFETRTQEVDHRPVVESLGDQERTQYILQIETEMQSTREALQQTVEELQSTNEELQSVNEELQSTNEELQATNEELETSNEELQSTNEELLTVNEEMRINATEFEKITRELSAVLAASPYPVLIVDQYSIIRGASDSALTYFGIERIPGKGLPLEEVDRDGSQSVLTQVAAHVLQTREQENCELYHGSDVHTAVLSPFSDTTGQQLGLTVSIYDNDTRAISLITDAIEQMGEIGSWRYNLNTDLLALSPAVQRRMGLRNKRSGVRLHDVESLLHPDDRRKIRKKLLRALRSRATFRFEARLILKSGRVLHVQITGASVLSESGKVISVVGAFRDVTSLLTSSMAIENMERMHNRLGLGLFSYDVDNKDMFMLGEAFDTLLVAGSTPTEKSVEAMIGGFRGTDQDTLRASLFELIEHGGEYDAGFTLDTGQICQVSAIARTLADGRVSHIYGTIQLCDPPISSEIPN